MRKFACVLGLGMVLLLARAAAAQEKPAQEAPKIDASLGYSFVQAHADTSGAPVVNLHGGSASLAYNLTNSFALVGDFGGYHVETVDFGGTIGRVNADTTVITYLFGPRLTYGRAKNKVVPYVQILFGGAHVGMPLGTDNAFAMSVGGGIDAIPSKHVGIRLVQIEYILSRFREGTPKRVTQNNLRVTTGMLFRFGR